MKFFTQQPTENPLQAQLLSQLRPAYTPEAIAWWPPAIGWWILAAISLVILITLVYGLARHHRHNRYRRNALTLLKQDYAAWQKAPESVQFAAHTSQLLRRVLLSIESRRAVSRLTGDAWVDHLERVGNATFSPEVRLQLAHHQYQANTCLTREDAKHLFIEAKRWLKHHKRGVEHA